MSTLPLKDAAAPENCEAVIIPDVFTLSSVPIPEAEPPINLPLDA